MRTNQIDRAVESFESALEQEKKLNPGQPQHAGTLNLLGVAAYQAGLCDKSLQYFQEATKIFDNHIERRYLTYFKFGKFLLAFQCYKDALDRFDMTMISSELYKTLCWNMAKTVMQLSIWSLRQSRPSRTLNELIHVNTVERDGKTWIVFDKDTFPDDVSGFYHHGLCCDFLGEQDDVLLSGYLEQGKEIARRFDYKCGKVVLVLLLLSLTYGKMGSFEKSRSYYKEAKEMAKNLPPEDDSILPGELGMIESMKKEC